jgi:hypothetical protein
MDLYSFLLFVGPLIASPAALGVAWYLWLRTPEDFEIAQWRRVLVFLGLLSASGNVVLFCAYVIRRNIFHGRYALGTGDVWSTVGFDLVLLAIFGSAFGRGRVALSIFLAALLGFGLWVLTAITIF